MIWPVLFKTVEGIYFVVLPFILLIKKLGQNELVFERKEGMNKYYVH